RDSSNVAVNHSLGHIKNDLTDVRAVGILVTDQVVDTTHLAPPSDPVGRAAAPPAVGERRPPAAQYMPKPGAGKEPKYCSRLGCPLWRGRPCNDTRAKQLRSVLVEVDQEYSRTLALHWSPASAASQSTASVLICAPLADFRRDKQFTNP